MCPELQKKDDIEKNETPNISLSSTTLLDEVYLQTLMIYIEGIKNQKLVRALIDTGSQRSYILRET